MHSKIERQVMASVGVVYMARLLLSRVALECYALALAALALWQLTWVTRVFANFAHVEHAGLGATMQYLSYAFVHTHLMTQAMLLVAAAAGLAFVVDVLRTLSRPSARFA